MSLINLNQINVADATGVVAIEGAILVLSQSDSNLWSSNVNGALYAPSGTSAERDAIIITPVEGHMRHNTDLQEFEVYANSAWRPIGQLTQDGTVLLPSRSFVNAPDTGSFLRAGADYAIAVNGDLRIEVNDTQTFICDILTVDGTVNNVPAVLNIQTPSTDTGSLNWKEDSIPTPKAFIRYNHTTSVFEISGNGLATSFHIDNSTNETTFDNDVHIDANADVSGNVEITGTTTFKDTLFLGDPGVETVELLPANIETIIVGTNVGLSAPLTYDGLTYHAVIVDYLFERTGTAAGTNDGLIVGTLHIASNGVTATLTDTTTAIIGSPVAAAPLFNTNPFVAAGTVTVQYNMGVGSGGGSAFLKYTVKRWGP